ncbi:alcohol dehydrogenase catalytic domain-containing protein [Streptomyces sp. NPDC088729]|uniref:alcohol dehydrogenase catalytic domain-containing protein n=1 Tax=Streptomyces sp. NPDC088729 TaxID=3365876 RepID=UPI0038167698
MLAAYIEQLGAPGTIRYGELPPPVARAGEVVVDVRVASANHVDTFVRSGAWRTPLTFPFVIGRDLAGTVAPLPAARRGEPRGRRRAGAPRRHRVVAGPLARRVTRAGKRSPSVHPLRPSEPGRRGPGARTGTSPVRAPGRRAVTGRAGAACSGSRFRWR